MTVTSNTGIPATPFLALIDSEQVLVINAATTTWTVERGYNGSIAAAHADGEAVQV
jgi:hypothetical protein